MKKQVYEIVKIVAESLPKKIKVMNINEIFKKYPENEPNYNGIHYMCIIKVSNNYVYSIEYYNYDAEWQLKEGITVEAFTELEPKLILNAL